MIWTERQREAGEEALEDARRDAAEELLAAEAEEVVFVCAQCGEEREEDAETCGSEECEAWLAADIAAAEGEDDPPVFAV